MLREEFCADKCLEYTIVYTHFKLVVVSLKSRGGRNREIGSIGRVNNGHNDSGGGTDERD